MLKNKELDAQYMFSFSWCSDTFFIDSIQFSLSMYHQLNVQKGQEPDGTQVL